MWEASRVWGAGEGRQRRRQTLLRWQLTSPLLPGKRTATPLPLWVSLMAGPVTSPCWPCTSVLPLGKVLLTPVKNTFSATL